MVKGNRGKGHLFQGNKGQILVEQRQYWGTENIRKSEQGNRPGNLFQRNKRTAPAPLGGPHLFSWTEHDGIGLEIVGKVAGSRLTGTSLTQVNMKLSRHD